MASISTQRDPAHNAFAVTPSDSDVITVSRALYVGTGGNLSVLMEGDTVSVTFAAVPSGVLLPLAVQQVLSTGTTASNIVAVY